MHGAVFYLCIFHDRSALTRVFSTVQGILPVVLLTTPYPPCPFPAFPWPWRLSGRALRSKIKTRLIGDLQPRIPTCLVGGLRSRVPVHLIWGEWSRILISFVGSERSCEFWFTSSGSSSFAVRGPKRLVAGPKRFPRLPRLTHLHGSPG